jgi:transmembrane sensor
VTRKTRSGRVLGAGAMERALSDPERWPLATTLETELEEAAIPELWHRIDARLAPPSSGRTRAVLGSALVAAAALVLLLVGRRWLGGTGEGALALANGRTPTVLSAAEGDQRFRFTDGSCVDVAPFTELHVVQNDARTFVAALERGRSTFDVRPGGPRRWVVEAGTASVEVIGTRFDVQREPTAVRVDVERGIVLVRSSALAGGSVRLTAGQSVVVVAQARAGSDPSAAAEAAPARLPDALSSRAHALEPQTPALEPPVSSAPALEVSSGSAAHSARPSARSTGAAPTDAVDSALSAADAARRRGDRLEAVRMLETALAAAGSGDKRRGLAALSLARLILTSEPARAASVLRESFGAMPVGLVEDALARRIEAEGRAGDFAEARRLASEYRRRFPEGQRSREVTRWSGD